MAKAWDIPSKVISLWGGLFVSIRLTVCKLEQANLILSFKRGSSKPVSECLASPAKWACPHVSIVKGVCRPSKYSWRDISVFINFEASDAIFIRSPPFSFCVIVFCQLSMGKRFCQSGVSEG